MLYGARQVGNTWILKEFGSNEYESFAYINCDDTPEIKTAFSDFETGRLIRFFSALTGVDIKPEKTLIVLDEVQEIPFIVGETVKVNDMKELVFLLARSMKSICIRFHSKNFAMHLVCQF